MQTELYTIQGVENILTPALIYYKDEISENTRKTIEIAGGAERLWPHVKSHKMKKMIEMQKAMGIHRFKCATLAEVKMVAECGAEHILLAYPLVGPNIKAFISLVKEFPKTHFYALEDDLSCLHALQAEAEKQNAVLGWFADVNMGRTVPAWKRRIFTNSSKQHSKIRPKMFHSAACIAMTATCTPPTSWIAKPR